MELLIPVIVYSPLPPVVFCVTLGLMLLRDKGKLDMNRMGVLVLSLVLALHAMLGDPSSNFQPTTNPSSLHGRVVSSPTRKTNRSLSYQLEIDSFSDAEGNVFTAQGKTYVFSKSSDVDYGDTITVHGTPQSAYFFAVSTEIQDRSPFGKMRRKLLPVLLRRLPEGDAGNMAALLLTGSSLDGSKDITDSAKSLGLSYLFALSGMHLGLLAFLFSCPLVWLGGKRLGRSCTFCLLALFVYLNGWKPSLLRALLFLFFSYFFEGSYAFLLSFLTMWVFVPGVMLDTGTMLSFLSLSGILIFSESIRKSLRFFLPCFPKTMGLVSASLGALFFTGPVMVETFGEWNPASVIFGIPGGVLLVTLFFSSILTIIIPKTDFILQTLYCVFQWFMDKGDSFQPTGDLKLWQYGVGVVLFLSMVSLVIENWKNIKDMTVLTYGRIKFLFS